MAFACGVAQASAVLSADTHTIRHGAINESPMVYPFAGKPPLNGSAHIKRLTLPNQMFVSGKLKTCASIGKIQNYIRVM